MRLLYVGGETVTAIAAAVQRKYPSFSITPITSLKALKYAVTRGEVADRAIVFDSLCDANFCPDYDSMTARRQIQITLGVIKENQEACLECVCIAQSPLTTQYFIEELYESTYNTAVFSVGAQLPLSSILAYSIKSIAELRKTSHKTAQQDIYQSDDDVIWSNKKIVTSTWTQLNSETIAVKLKDKFRLNVALDLLDFWLQSATWEYKEDIVALKSKTLAPPPVVPKVDEMGRKLTDRERRALKKERKKQLKVFKQEQKQRLREEKQRLKEESKRKA